MPPPRAIPASFWRGGTSRGLILRASVLAAYPPATRNAIIRSALGSPDPNGRQIDGLGGGVSSLSKAMVLGLPGEGMEQQRVNGKLEGVAWADEGEKEGVGRWDLVYRFCQVGVRDEVLDWSSTCGNMLSAVALSSLSSPSLLPYTTLHSRARSLPPPPVGQPLMFPLSILSASNGALMRARVPLDPVTLEPWELSNSDEEGGVSIAGVPGRAAGIEVELPLSVDESAPPAGAVYSATLEGYEVRYSILSSGLPNILLPLSCLSSPSSPSSSIAEPIPSSLLTAPASSLTSHPFLLPFLERIRRQISTTHSIPFSLSSPKIVLLGPLPSSGYETSSSTHVAAADAHLVARTISSGDVHATIPATTLACIAIGLGTPGSVVHRLVHGHPLVGSGGAEEPQEGVTTVRVGNAAGVAESSVRFERSASAAAGEGKAEGKGRVEPKSVVMVRTAREIMRGSVMVPGRFFED